MPAYAPPPQYSEFLQRMLMRARESLGEEFRGITADGIIRPGLFPVHKTGVSLDPILRAARDFTATLDAQQKANDDWVAYQRQAANAAAAKDEANRQKAAAAEATTAQKLSPQNQQAVQQAAQANLTGQMLQGSPAAPDSNVAALGTDQSADTSVTKDMASRVTNAARAAQDRIKGLDIGADDYLIKPFDLGELLARLRALIRRAARQAKSRLELGQVILDTRAKTVTRAGRAVALTAREYAILEYLALHRGDLIARTELYEHLFDETDDTLSNLLDVHIFSIRKKLGRELIATRRGQGYCIEK